MTTKEFRTYAMSNGSYRKIPFTKLSKRQQANVINEVRDDGLNECANMLEQGNLYDEPKLQMYIIDMLER